MPDPSIEEKVARAICEQWAAGSWDDQGSDKIAMWKGFARAALAALQREGEGWRTAPENKLYCPCCKRPAGTPDPLTPEDFTGAELETLGVLAEAGVEHGDWVPPVLEAWDSAKAKIVARLRALASTGQGDGA